MVIPFVDSVSGAAARTADVLEVPGRAVASADVEGGARMLLSIFGKEDIPAFGVEDSSFPLHARCVFALLALFRLRPFWSELLEVSSSR